MTEMPEHDPIERREVPDEPPPFLGTWRRIYVSVLGYLAAIIALFYLFEVLARP